MCHYVYRDRTWGYEWDLVPALRWSGVPSSPTQLSMPIGLFSLSCWERRLTNRPRL